MMLAPPPMPGPTISEWSLCRNAAAASRPRRAREIVDAVRSLPNVTPRMVGLFADQPLAEVNAVAARCGLDAAQLCGAETPAYAAAVDCPVIKAVHVPASYRAPGEVPELAARDGRIRRNGLHRNPGPAGGGVAGRHRASFDLEVAAALARRGAAFLLAGGLTPANVGRAISAVRPWGVDVSSGVETLGRKDRRKNPALYRQRPAGRRRAYRRRLKPRRDSIRGWRPNPPARRKCAAHRDTRHQLTPGAHIR